MVAAFGRPKFKGVRAFGHPEPATPLLSGGALRLSITKEECLDFRTSRPSDVLSGRRYPREYRSLSQVARTSPARNLRVSGPSDTPSLKF